MATTSKKMMITDVFVNGAFQGWNIATHSTIPNVLMAFVIIKMLNISGALDFIGTCLGPVMAIFGLPGEAAMILLGGWMSMGGGVGVAVALFDTMPTGTAVLFDPSIMAPVHQMVPGKGNFFLEQLAKTGAGETYQIFGQIGLDHGPEWMSAKFTNISTDLPSKLTATTKPGE